MFLTHEFDLGRGNELTAPIAHAVLKDKCSFPFLQYLPSEQNPAYVSQSAKFDPSSKIYEVRLKLRFPANY